MLPGKDLAKPSTIATPWTHVPMASKLGAAPLKQSRHDGTLHLMKSRNRSRCFAHVFPCRKIYSMFIFLTISNKTAKRSEQFRNVPPFIILLLFLFFKIYITVRISHKPAFQYFHHVRSILRIQLCAGTPFQFRNYGTHIYTIFISTL